MFEFRLKFHWMLVNCYLDPWEQTAMNFVSASMCLRSCVSGGGDCIDILSNIYDISDETSMLVQTTRLLWCPVIFLYPHPHPHPYPHPKKAFFCVPVIHDTGFGNILTAGAIIYMEQCLSHYGEWIVLVTKCRMRLLVHSQTCMSGNRVPFIGTPLCHI